MGSRSDFQRGYRGGYRGGYEDGFKNRPIRTEIYRLSDNYDPDLIVRHEENDRYYHNWSYLAASAAFTLTRTPKKANRRLRPVPE